MAAAGDRNHFERKWFAVSPAQEKVLVALTIFCFTEALKLATHELLPSAVRFLAGILGL